MCVCDAVMRWDVTFSTVGWFCVVMLCCCTERERNSVSFIDIRDAIHYTRTVKTAHRATIHSPKAIVGSAAASDTHDSLTARATTDSSAATKDAKHSLAGAPPPFRDTYLYLSCANGLWIHDRSESALGPTAPNALFRPLKLKWNRPEQFLPKALALTRSGVLIVAESRLAQILAVDPPTGRVIVLSGCSPRPKNLVKPIDGPALEACYFNPSGLALSADQHSLWITDRKITTSPCPSLVRVLTLPDTIDFDATHTTDGGGESYDWSTHAIDQVRTQAAHDRKQLKALQKQNRYNFSFKPTYC